MKVPAGGVHMDPHRHARMMHNEHPLFIAEQCWKGSSGVDRSRHCILTCTCADHTPVYGRSTSSAQALCHPAPAPQTLCQLVPSRDMRHWRMAQMCQQHYAGHTDHGPRIVLSPRLSRRVPPVDWASCPGAYRMVITVQPPCAFHVSNGRVPINNSV